MTEERAAGPRMPARDKEGSRGGRGLEGRRGLRRSLCKSDSNLENPGNASQCRACVSCFFLEGGKLIVRLMVVRTMWD